VTAQRQIFRASAIIGAASVINMVIGILKVKVLAVLLGPVGVGLLGLYQSIMGVASTLAGCGVSSSGIRQLAASQENAATLTLVRKALFYANLLLGLTGMVLLWLLREPVTHWVFGNTEHAAEVGYLGVGVLLTVFASSQTALLQGMRRIGDLGRVQVLSALASAVTGIISVLLWGRSGMIAFILAGPAASVLVAAWYARRLPFPEAGHDWVELHRQWQAMFSLGIPLMASGLLTLVVELIARTLVMQNLGLESTGFFQAAWAISMTYLGFVLNAMGADYYPRLTSVIHDRERAVKIVNEQTEMLLLLAGPVLLAMMTLAPLVIELLYTESFAPATKILHWQVMGDIVKVMTWPMGFVVMAQGRGGMFIGTQLNWNVIYLGFVWFGLPELGLVAMGVGFFLAYLSQITVVRVVAGRLIGFKAEARNLWLFVSLILAASLIFATTFFSANLSYGLGAILTLSVFIYSVHRLNALIDMLNWIKLKIGSGE
jgi:O-antigen/teichoic acid export membrane protein